MANAKVQATSAVEGTTGTTGTSLSVTAGNILLLSVLCNQTGNTIDTPTDDQGNTWNAVAASQSEATFGKARLFWTIATATGTNVVQAPISGGAGGYKETIYAEFSGPTGLDTGSGVTDTTLNLTPAATGELAVCFFAGNNGGQSAGSGWTLTQAGTDAVLGHAMMEHKLDAGTGSLSFAITDAGPSTHYAIFGALFTVSATASSKGLMLLGVG